MTAPFPLSGLAMMMLSLLRKSLKTAHSSQFAVACVAAVSFLFPGGDRTSERKAGERKASERRSTPGVNKKMERSGEGVREKEKGVGRKGIACSPSQTFYRTPYAHERGAIVQFDWLLARQSKYHNKNLSFMHNQSSGTQQDQHRYGRG